MQKHSAKKTCFLTCQHLLHIVACNMIGSPTSWVSYCITTPAKLMLTNADRPVNITVNSSVIYINNVWQS